jgi:hypothetical protein
MSSAGLLEYSLALGAWATAAALSGRRRDHLPVAAALAVGPLADLAHKELAASVVVPAQDAMRAAGLDPFVEPLRGVPFAAGVLCQGLFMAHAFAIVGLAARVFQGWRAWPVLLAWVGFMATFAVEYEHLRGHAARVLFVPVELACIALALGFAIQWTWKRRAPSVRHGATVLVVLIECVVALLFSGVLTEIWGLARQVYLVLYFVLAVVQGGALCSTFGSQRSR